MQFSTSRRQYTLVGILLLWCGALLAYWRLRVPDPLALGMVWNLFLAALPLGFSAAFRRALLQQKRVLAGFAFGCWLLFFPNAPYVLTDLIHLHNRGDIPLWHLLATLISCGATGAWLGYLSLEEVHLAVERRWGRKAGWAVAGGSLLLAAFGIYLGRFLRYNSWDVFLHPLSLFKTILRQSFQVGAYPHPLPVTLVFGTSLLLGYLVLRGSRVSGGP